MQGQQQNQLDMQIVMKEYQDKVGELTNQVLILQAYVKQLEKQLEEATTTHVDAEQK